MPSSRPTRFALGLAALLLAGPALAGPVLQSGALVLNDQQWGFDTDPDTGEDFTWTALIMVDPDIDTSAESTDFLYDDRDLRRSWMIEVLSLEEILIADSYADPAGLGFDANPENQNPFADDDTGGHGAIFLADEVNGRLFVVSDGTEVIGGLPAGVPSAFTGPRDLVVLPDGDLLVVDPDSDVAGFGFDPGRTDLGVDPHAGYGAILRVDLGTGAVEVVADGSNYVGGIPDIDGDTVAEPSIFIDPWAMHWDPSRPDTLYLLDTLADPLGLGYAGAVFQVDIPTGQVEYIASSSSFQFLNDITWKDSLGALLVVDASTQQPPVPRVWQVDLDGSVSQWAEPSDLEFPWSIFTDDSDVVHVVDSDADPLGFGFLVGPGAAFQLPDVNPDNAQVAHSSSETIFLTSGDFVPSGPYPVVDPLPLGPLCAGQGTDIVLTGSGFDPDAIVMGVGELEVTAFNIVDPNTATATIDISCDASAGTHPIRVFNPSTRVSGKTDLVIDFTQSDPSPPSSPVGDINGDQRIDGVDLSIMGLAFGSQGCCDLGFDNDADLNNDGIVDGLDLDILAPSFGVRLGP